MFSRRGKKERQSEDPVDPAVLYAQAKELRKDFKNVDQVEALLRRAGELGHKVASCDLGVLLERQFRFDEARSWFEKARDQGHVLAERMLAGLNDKQSKTEADHDPTFKRLESEAAQGNPEAMVGLGRRLVGLNRRTKAAEWIARAVAEGHRPGVRELAEASDVTGFD